MTKKQKFKWEPYTMVALGFVALHILIASTQSLTGFEWNRNPNLAVIFFTIKLASTFFSIFLGYMGATSIKQTVSSCRHGKFRKMYVELFLARIAYLAGYIGFFYYPVYAFLDLYKNFHD